VKVIGDEPANTDYDPGPSEQAVSRGEERERGQDKPVEVSIAREIIRVRSVRSRLEGDDGGFIRITEVI
jgi:C-terminal processing protease CtpA/Prc